MGAKWDNSSTACLGFGRVWLDTAEQRFVPQHGEMNLNQFIPDPDTDRSSPRSHVPSVKWRLDPSPIPLLDWTGSSFTNVMFANIFLEFIKHFAAQQKSIPLEILILIQYLMI